MRLNENEGPLLSLQDLRPYGSDEPHVLPSRRGVTERNGAIAVMFLEGGEKSYLVREMGKLYSSRRKHFNTPLQEFEGQVRRANIRGGICAIPVVQNQLVY